MSALEQRLTKLEKECRLHRMFWGGLVLILCAFTLWGATKPIPEVIQARKFEVLNEQGKLTAMLGDGLVAVGDPTGKVKGLFGTTKQGNSFLVLRDTEGKNGVFLGTSPSLGYLTLLIRKDKTVGFPEILYEMTASLYEVAASVGATRYTENLTQQLLRSR